MNITESAFTVDCGNDRLVAILHAPDAPADLGVVIVVGGPQYRVGSHRQFVLLAREVAKAGFACLRFDYRGLGDSDGALRGFEGVHDDIRAAIDRLTVEVPGVKRVVLWGLCDGATASGFYAAQDARVVGVVLLNPWVRSDQSLARSLLFHYYVKRFIDVRAWWGILGKPSALFAAIRSLFRTAKKVLVTEKVTAPDTAPAVQDSRERSPQPSPSRRPPLAKRLGGALQSFKGDVLVILSSADITANEFVEAAKSERALRRRLAQDSVTQFRLADADHTFSTRRWRDQVSSWTCDWLRDRAASRRRS